MYEKRVTGNAITTKAPVRLQGRGSKNYIAMIFSSAGCPVHSYKDTLRSYPAGNEHSPDLLFYC